MLIDTEGGKVPTTKQNLRQRRNGSGQRKSNVAPSLRASSCSLLSAEDNDLYDSGSNEMLPALSKERRWSVKSLVTFEPMNTPLGRSMESTSENKRYIYGKTVSWKSVEDGGLHRDPADLERYRQVGDPPMDDLMERLEVNHGFVFHPHQDMFQVLEDPSISKAVKVEVQSFVDSYSQLPEWVDLHQLERGQNVYHQFATSISVSLYYQALVPGFSIPRIAQVILSTAYLAPPSTPSMVTTRLLDTGAFLVSNMLSPESLRSTTGEGWKAALQVRLLHAKVRQRLLKRKRQPWDTAEFGVPINQEDMAGTLLAFSWICLVGIEFTSGIGLDENCVMDYLALWRYIGWLLGVQTEGDEVSLSPLDPCRPVHYGPQGISWPPYGHSKAMLESILNHLLDPSETSRLIANHLLNIGSPKEKRNGGLVKKPLSSRQNNATRQMGRFHYFHRARTLRRCIGAPLADALQIPYHDGGILWQGLVSFTSLLFLWSIRVYTWYCILRPSWAKRFHRRMTKGFLQRWTGGGGEQDDTEDDDTKKIEEVPDTSSTPRASCPFAFTAVPALDE